MNERIKEFAEQAGWDMGNEVDGFSTRLEKFAELVRAPRQWVGLTKEEVTSLIPCLYNIYDAEDYRDFARAIEDKLKEKNNVLG